MGRRNGRRMTARGGKHRHGKIKRQHAMIEGLEEALAPVVALDSVSLVVPGRITRGGGTVQMFLTVSVRTPDGIKLLARSRGRIQEVFVVTSDPGGVEKIVLQIG